MLTFEGITVVSLEQAIAAPFATRQLADTGARVIKIERPGTGDFARGYDKTVNGLSSHFVWTNRSKESVTLDLKKAEASGIMTRLIAEADVFVQNLAPGAAARMGLDFESLSKAHPRLIVCDISGYSETGPYRNKKAYDLLVQAETGAPMVTGTPDSPSKTGMSIADIAAGMYAYSGILSALYQREKTGLGTRIEVSLFDSLTEWMGFPLYYANYGGTAPARTGASHATIFPYGPFKAGDGKIVMLGIQNEREWKAFCEQVLMQPELARAPEYSDNVSRSKNRDALSSIIHNVFSTLDADGVLERLDSAGIANSRMNTLEEVWQHPQLKDRWRQVETEAGPIKAVLPPVRMAGIEARMGAIPACGEHTDKILLELGYEENQIAAFRADKIV